MENEIQELRKKSDSYLNVLNYLDKNLFDENGICYLNNSLKINKNFPTLKIVDKNLSNNKLINEFDNSISNNNLINEGDNIINNNELTNKDNIIHNKVKQFSNYNIQKREFSTCNKRLNEIKSTKKHLNVLNKDKNEIKLNISKSKNIFLDFLDEIIKVSEKDPVKRLSHPDQGPDSQRYGCERKLRVQPVAEADASL